MNKTENTVSWRLLPYAGAFIFASVGWLAGYPTIINPDVEVPFTVLVLCSTLFYWGIYIFSRLRNLKQNKTYWVSILCIIVSIRVIPWISYDLLQH
jgi:hypothetical protein